MHIDPQPLTREAFAPFGDVIDVPNAPGRTYYEDALGNLRPNARASLSMVLAGETPVGSLRTKLLERHEFSSQTFVPVDVARWLVVVAPHAAAGGPDLAGVKAFIANGQQGVTYKPNTWHHGLTVLDKPARFAVFMWRVGGLGDKEFVSVEPFTIRIP